MVTHCYKCKYSKQDWTNPNNPDKYCSNEDSEWYGYNTDVVFGCRDGKENVGKFGLGQRVRIVRAGNVRSRFGIIHELCGVLPCYFVKVGVKEDYSRCLLKIYGNDVEHCVLLGEDSLEKLE